MTATINTKQGDFKITATYKGDKKATFFNTDNWNNHLVSVSHKGVRTSFDFWGSIVKPELDSREDLKHALYCFLSDAIAAKESFESFCSEFGYDSDSRTAEKVYKACERSLKKAERLVRGDIYDLVNELND